MIPKASQGIAHIAARITQDLVVQPADAYFAADLRFISALTSMVAQDYDRAADILISEHAEIIDLLQRSLPHIADERLLSGVGEAIAVELRSYRLSHLDERADLVMKALIEVHEYVESAREREEGWATDLDLQIWGFLELWAARRVYQI